MDENTKEIVDALTHINNHIGQIVPNAILTNIVEELKEINKRLDNLKTK